MAEDVEEGSIYNQIKAIEGWALKAYRESVKKSPNVDQILDNLRMINAQARKLEWRAKGLKSLPEGQVSEDLKKKITQLRAAIVTLRDLKKDKTLGNATKRAIRVLASEAEQARKLVEEFAKGLPDLSKIMRDYHQIEDFLRGEGEYVSYALDVRRKLWNEFVQKRKEHAQLNDLNLSRIDLSGFHFRKTVFQDVDFSGSNLQKCDFEGSVFFNFNVKWGGDFSEANFTESEIKIKNGTFTGNFTRANFTGSKIIGVTFDGKFREANFTGSRLEGQFTGDFKGAIFRSAEIDFIQLNLITFADADFRGARVVIRKMLSDKINFTGANVSRADFAVLGDAIEGSKKRLEELLTSAKGNARISSNLSHATI